MSSNYLGEHFDGSLDIRGIPNREELERRQRDRLNRALATVLITSQIPRRLGSDASPEELAMDKKRSRRVAHALRQSLLSWQKKIELQVDDEIRRDGAQLNWDKWSTKFLTDLRLQMSCVATWAVAKEDEDWGKSALVRLKNEENWLTYALRE